MDLDLPLAGSSSLGFIKLCPLAKPKGIKVVEFWYFLNFLLCRTLENFPEK
jgi:hypothetical protein